MVLKTMRLIKNQQKLVRFKRQLSLKIRVNYTFDNLILYQTRNLKFKNIIIRSYTIKTPSSNITSKFRDG